MLQANKTWMAVVGAVLLAMPACVDDETTAPEDFESTGDVELEAEPRLLVGDEAIAFHEARTSGAALAAGLVHRCQIFEFVAPAGGGMTWWSCVSSDHHVWMRIDAEREISRSYAQLSVAGIDQTTGFRSFPKIQAAPFARVAVVDLDATGMWRPGDSYVAASAVKGAGQPWSWPLISPSQQW